jgi:hypothetical protein
MQPSKTTSPKNWRLSAITPVGIVAITLGFLFGMYELDHPKLHWL